MEHQHLRNDMKEVFVKKYWAEDDIMFYLHFQNKEAVRQIELTTNGKTFLSIDNPIEGDSMLYDQTIEELELEESDFIMKEEFDKIWNDR